MKCKFNEGNVKNRDAWFWAAAVHLSRAADNHDGCPWSIEAAIGKLKKSRRRSKAWL